MFTYGTPERTYRFPLGIGGPSPPDYIHGAMQRSGDQLPSTAGRITIECRFFARYAEALGREVLRLELPESATVADAVRELRRTLPASDVLPERPLAAVNREHTPLMSRLTHGDELAFLPPLAGG